MLHARSGLRLTSVVFAAIAAATVGTAAAQQDSFYAGKTISIIVGFTPGGGYDLYARMLARHIGPHIPGKPHVIVQNMPGAGSLTSVRYVAAAAPKDGTVISAFNPGLITESLTDPDKLKLTFSDFAWIGSITNDYRICYAWHSTGIKSWDDLAKGAEFIMGATGPNTSNYVNGAVLRNLFGLKVKQVLGFPGSNEMRLAVERGELHGDCGSYSSLPAEWLKQNRIIPLVSFSPGRQPDLPASLPFAGDLASSEDKKKVFRIVIAAGEVGRPYILSKQVPVVRVEILRVAFDLTMKDPAFLAEARKQDMPVNPSTGKDAEKIVAEIYTAPAELVAQAKAAMK